MERTIPNLKRYREELVPKISQEALAKEANISFTNYTHVERGRTTTNRTGRKILVALNRLRISQGLQELSLEDLGLNIA